MRVDTRDSLEEAQCVRKEHGLYRVEYRHGLHFSAPPERQPLT